MPDLKLKVSPAFPHFGDVFDAELDPVVGSETGKRRPAVVVSNNVNNEFSNTVTILPVTSKTAKKVYSFEVYVPKGIAGLTEDSRIKADQVRTIDKKRLKTFRGFLPVDFLSKVDVALKVHLNMKIT
jgi:mRNA interferase MazF